MTKLSVTFGGVFWLLAKTVINIVKIIVIVWKVYTLLCESRGDTFLLRGENISKRDVEKGLKGKVGAGII